MNVKIFYLLYIRTESMDTCVNVLLDGQDLNAKQTLTTVNLHPVKITELAK